MKYFGIAYLILIFAAAAQAGEIDGVIYHASQELEGASVTFAGQTVITNAAGRFFLENVPSGDQSLHIAYPDGKQTKIVSVVVLPDMSTLFSFDFSEEPLTLDEVMVYGEPVIEATPGKQTMQISEVLRMTGAANDPLRALQILPGITAPNSILAGLYVRGGGPDDNAYYFVLTLDRPATT